MNKRCWPCCLQNVTSLPCGSSCSNEHVQWRQQQPRKSFIESNKQISETESSQLSNLLAEYHDIFSLEDDERGETDLVEFKIDTGDACPKRQAVRRVPFAAQKEIADQLEGCKKWGGKTI